MIQNLAEKLSLISPIESKLELLYQLPVIHRFLLKNPKLRRFLSTCSLEQQLIILEIIAIGQGEKLFSFFSKKSIGSLIQQLLPVENMYSSLGGIIGYQAHIEKILRKRLVPHSFPTNYQIFQGIDLRDYSKAKQYIIEGIKALPQIAEIYPLGGSADRLNLFNPHTREPLPAARLNFLGQTLLEGLIRDLQSREYLYYKLFDQQLVTPIAIMTSEDKNNHQHILTICKEARWFGRPQHHYKFFCQPLVPTIDSNGDWLLQNKNRLLMKPGGHGVIWKLAKEEKVFDWLLSLKRTKALVRQVNNPVANTDYGLIAFTGVGWKQNKKFGFASCPRQVHASEGVNVLIETVVSSPERKPQFQYTLTSIEYCDFSHMGIEDQPDQEGSVYSKFPSNTNILFVDLFSALEISKSHPIPGMLVNLRQLPQVNQTGIPSQPTARLESTMQNIADYFVDKFDVRLSCDEHIKMTTFLTTNERSKTISAIKHTWDVETGLLETPEQCFLDMLKNSKDLLVNYCHYQLCLEPINDPLNPPFFFSYHPALGPLYSIIGQKIRGGMLQKGSEIQLEISEVDLENLSIEGSLIIQAKQVLGHYNSDDQLVYSERCGRCRLKNIQVINAGIDRSKTQCYWNNHIFRQEACHILLQGNSELYAENITFKGNYFLEVPDQHRCCIFQKGEKIIVQFEKMTLPTWFWKMEVNVTDTISLTRKINNANEGINQSITSSLSPI